MPCAPKTLRLLSRGLFSLPRSEAGIPTSLVIVDLGEALP